jgi:hypothetical protein
VALVRTGKSLGQQQGELCVTLCSWVFISLVVSGCAGRATADQITFGGVISQSALDGTGPAVNNPTLNNILDGEAYTVAVTFTGSISSPGTYPLVGASLAFSDPSGPSAESGFDSVSLSVVPDGAFFDISLLGCLSTGSGCLLGNELDANFSIPAAGLNSQNVFAQAISGLTPLDLLEDDGITDIQGSAGAYSYVRQNPVPEPSSLLLSFLALAPVAWRTLRRQLMKK